VSEGLLVDNDRGVSELLTASAEETPIPPRRRSFIDDPRIRQACNWLAAALFFYWVIKRLWPAPNGILVKGAVVGGLYALIALGILLGVPEADCHHPVSVVLGCEPDLVHEAGLLAQQRQCRAGRTCLRCSSASPAASCSACSSSS